MLNLKKELENVKTVAIAGHVHPDGDCIGSVMGCYHYLKENFPQVQADAYLEYIKPEFSLMPDLDEVHDKPVQDRHYDLLIILDVSSVDRIGVIPDYRTIADRCICIDHHITNTHFCDEDLVCPKASSACEVLYGLLEDEKISRETAICLYTGMVTDSGVFQYDSTSEKTMQIAGKLMAKGIPFTRIIKSVFYEKTWKQLLILGKVCQASQLQLGGRAISGIATLTMMQELGATTQDLDGIVEQLNNTTGVHCAVFLHEKEPGIYKVSLRSDDQVNVSLIASKFGGGGHIKASGCSMEGDAETVLAQILAEVEAQLVENL